MKTSWGTDIEFADVAEAHEEVLAGIAGVLAHSRFLDSSGRAIRWTYNGNGTMAKLSNNPVPGCEALIREAY